MILLDTSALVGSLCGRQLWLGQLREFLEAGEPLALPAPVLYEWWRGPRTELELENQRQLFPEARVLPFEAADAELAAGVYRKLRRPRTRQMDIAIAAVALRHGAALWTLNRPDFEDIPALRLAATARP